MAAKDILSQLNIVEVAALTDSGTAFIGFGAKADGLYMKNGADAEKRLLTTDDSAGTDFVPYTGAIANLNMGAFGILATNIAASGTAPDISCTKTSTGNIATLTASGTTTGYPRGSFLIGSTDGDAISNAGLTIAADVSSAVQKPVFVEVKTNVLSSVSCMRLALKQSTTLAEIIASSNSGSTVGTPISIYTYGNSNQLYINTNGRIGFGTASPTATVHIKAGSATANTAPLKFTSGALLTAPEAGAFEFLTDGLYFTITTGTARKQLEFVGHGHTTANLTDWAAATASYVTGTPWTGMGYITSQTSHADVLVDGDFASQGIMLRGASAGVYSILADNSANWNTAFGWGNHAGLYSLLAHTHSGYQSVLSGTGFVKSTAGVISYDTNTYVTGTPWTGMGYVTGTPWTSMGYLTSQTSHADVLVDGDFASQGIMLRGATSGVYSVLADNSTNWNTAYTHSQITANNPHTTKLSQLSDVDLADGGSGPPAYGDIMFYNSSHVRWHNYSLPEAGIQATLQSGVNIKTVGGTSLVGSGDVPFVVPDASVSRSKLIVYNGGTQGNALTYDVTYGLTWSTPWTGMGYLTSITKAQVEAVLTGAIATHTHALTSHALTSHSDVSFTYTPSTGDLLRYNGTAWYQASLGVCGIQATLVSGTNIKTINSSSILGSGNLVVSAVWGGITGTLSSQTDLNTALNAKALLAGSSTQAFSTANLSVTGTINATSTITGSEVYRGSSRTLKKDIADFDFDAIGFLNDVSIKRYYLKSNNLFGIGFIAEDTHSWLSGDDQKSHVFGNHLGLLTKAIQEEDQKVEAMKLEVLELRARVRELEIARQNGWR